ncbi:hypothetical protein [Microvirga puerhi]|uniref:Uncharacterized protein n=1 Tax=Microvirga puerhi TaxID=2876078 RepID=A0ABS7VTN5_9HYPH|nr:hypothetical protein [Microvirga puerhi]MBZ6078933.1 hypothetical protein [Microvirga puerhi]
MTQRAETAAQNGSTGSVIARMIDGRAHQLFIDPATQTFATALETLEFKGADEYCQYHVFLEMADEPGAPARWAYAGEHDGKIVVMKGFLGPAADLSIACAGVGLICDDGDAKYQSGSRFSETGQFPLEEQELFGEIAEVRNLDNVSLYQMKREAD